MKGENLPEMSECEISERHAFVQLSRRQLKGLCTKFVELEERFVNKIQKKKKKKNISWFLCEAWVLATKKIIHEL